MRVSGGCSGGTLKRFSTRGPGRTLSGSVTFTGGVQVQVQEVPCHGPVYIVLTASVPSPPLTRSVNLTLYFPASRRTAWIASSFHPKSHVRVPPRGFSSTLRSYAVDNPAAGSGGADPERLPAAARPCADLLRLATEACHRTTGRRTRRSPPDTRSQRHHEMRTASDTRWRHTLNGSSPALAVYRIQRCPVPRALAQRAPPAPPHANAASRRLSDAADLG